jgi:DNA repair protein RadC
MRYMLIKEMRPEEKPREKFMHAPHMVTMTDLVAILLRTGRKGRNVREVAQDVVNFLESQYGKMGFEEPYWQDLTSISGIGPDKAVTICAAIELGRRLAGRFNRRNLISFNSPDKVADYFMEMLRHENQEHFYACYLNVKNRFLGSREIGRGSLSAAPVDMKEVFRWGLRLKAYGIILVHNHPTGYPDPSEADIALTRKMYRAARLLDFHILDHVIIGDGLYTSMHDKGII